MEELRPNAQRGRYALALIWVILVFTIIILIGQVLQLLMLNTDIPDFIYYITLGGIGYVGILYSIAYIVSAVTFIMWFRRAYYNLRVKTGKTEYGDGWAAGGWFVPFLNLYMPYKIMKELYTKTDRYLYYECEEPYTNRLNKSYVAGWWALLLISGVIGRISFRIEWRETYEVDPEVTLFLSIISSLLIILSAIITIVVIKDYMEAEKLFNEANENAENVSLDNLYK